VGCALSEDLFMKQGDAVSDLSPVVVWRIGSGVDESPFPTVREDAR